VPKRRSLQKHGDGKSVYMTGRWRALTAVTETYGHASAITCEVFVKITPSPVFSLLQRRTGLDGPRNKTVHVGAQNGISASVCILHREWNEASPIKML